VSEGDEREESARVVSGRFGGAKTFQLFMVNFNMEIIGAPPLLFYWKQNT
jgi:hypothetical protein